MLTSHTFRRLSGITTAVLLALALNGFARAEIDTAQSMDKLTAAVQQARGKCILRKYGNGVRRVCFNTGNRAAIDAVRGMSGAGANVLQICHFNTPDSTHTLGLFDGRAPHFQTPDGFRTWMLNDWGGPYSSRTQIYTALIQLTPGEGKRLRKMFDEGRQQMRANPNRTVTSGWARGNCASIWTDLPVGDHGETLAQLIGLYSNGSPRGLQQDLETRANGRVFAVGVFGPNTPNFGDQNVTTWRLP